MTRGDSNEGQSVAQIAKSAKKSEATIRHWLNETGVKWRATEWATDQ